MYKPVIKESYITVTKLLFLLNAVILYVVHCMLNEIFLAKFLVCVGLCLLFVYMFYAQFIFSLFLSKREKRKRKDELC